MTYTNKNLLTRIVAAIALVVLASSVACSFFSGPPADAFPERVGGWGRRTIVDSNRLREGHAQHSAEYRSIQREGAQEPTKEILMTVTVLGSPEEANVWLQGGGRAAARAGDIDVRIMPGNSSSSPQPSAQPQPRTRDGQQTGMRVADRSSIAFTSGARVIMLVNNHRASNLAPATLADLEEFERSLPY